MPDWDGIGISQANALNGNGGLRRKRFWNQKIFFGIIGLSGLVDHEKFQRLVALVDRQSCA